MNSRREFLRKCALAATAFAAGHGIAGCGPSSAPAPRAAGSGRSAQRPNILFIFTDDHAAQAISAYGSNRNRTPNIDRLAREGMLFENCFVTNSICAPSRAVIQTGKFSHLNGVPTNREAFDSSQQTFPKLLQQAGYQTAIFGKWHLKSEPAGYDHYKVLRGQGPYYNPVLLTPAGEEEHTGYTTDIITEETLAWLGQQRDQDRPFMLMCQHKAPHRRWTPGPAHMDDYDGEMVPEPPTLFDDYEGRGTAARDQEMTVARHLNEGDLKLVPPSSMNEQQLEMWKSSYGAENEAYRTAELSPRDSVRWKYQRYIKDYLRAVASVDDGVGRILDYLESSGLAENTIVIYNSDQGFYLGEHGWFDKRFMYEESLRMPFIVRWPGVTDPGSRNSDLVQNLDFAPTFLDIAGADIPADMQGQSLVPLLEGRTPAGWRESIYYHYYEYPAVHMVHRHYGVRTRRYKLIYFYRLDEWEFYDLQRDPHELRSLYGNPFYEDKIEELKRELTRLRQLYRVPEEDPVDLE